MVEVKIERGEIYAPHIEDYVRTLLPTVTVKKAGRSYARIGTGSLITLASYNVGAGSVLRLTFLNFSADRECMFHITDRDGTVHWDYLESAGGISHLGKPEAPIHVLKGSVRFRSVAGTMGIGVGTYLTMCTMEGIDVQRKMGIR